MKKPEIDTRINLGVGLLVAALLLAITGAGVTWGISGACFAGAITLAIYGFVSFGSCAD